MTAGDSRACEIVVMAFCLSVAVGSAQCATASDAQKSQTLSGLPSAAQSAISTALGRDQVQYHVMPGPDGVTLANPAHGLTARLQSGALRVESGAHAWEMSLKGFGYDGAIMPVGTARITSSANRVDCDYGAINVWYVNGPCGLEQGFTVAPSPAMPHLQGVSGRGGVCGTSAPWPEPAERLACGNPGIAQNATEGGYATRPVTEALPSPGQALSDGAGSLTVALRLDGNLVAALDTTGHGLRLTLPDGTTALRYSGLTACDAAGLVLPARMELRPSGTGQELLIHVNTAGAQGAITIDPFIQSAKLTASDGDMGDYFGHSVAISGDTVVVATPFPFIGGNQFQGAAYVFVQPGSGWANMTQTAKLVASDGAYYDFFGSSITINGNTVVVGAPQATIGPNQQQGAAYVFVQPDSGWADMTETAKLVASDGTAYSDFGLSVAISGNTVVVGAECATVGTNQNQGATYVFVRPASGWANMTETAKLVASDGAARDYFGESVAISGDTVVVASYCANRHLGAAYVFVRPGPGWANMTQTAKLLASDGAADDYSGGSVAISGDTVVIGAPGATIGSNQCQGVAYVFVKPGSGWTNMPQTAKLTASDGAAYDRLGYSVAISGNTVVAGAYQATIGSNQYQGTAYVFVQPGSGWENMTQTAKSVASDGTTGDRFGVSVAISGNTVVVGAYCATVGAHPGQGAAYVLDSATATTTTSSTFTTTTVSISTTSTSSTTERTSTTTTTTLPATSTTSTTTSTTGATTTVTMLPHPADTNHSFTLAIGEMTAYGAAWKKGQSWPEGPSPIVIGYVTRAGYLWRMGEAYHYNPTADPAVWPTSPAVWLPGAAARPR